MLLRQAEWKFQLHAFICSPLACRLREQGYGPIGLHVINLLGTMKREHLNVSWLFRQALSEGLLLYAVRITKQGRKKGRRTIKEILQRRVHVSLGVHQPHWMGLHPNTRNESPSSQQGAEVRAPIQAFRTQKVE